MSRYVTALILLLSISVPVLVQSSARAGDAPMKKAPAVKGAARSAPAAGPGQTDLVVRKYQATLDQRITEQKKAQGQLDLANKAARDADRVVATKNQEIKKCVDSQRPFKSTFEGMGVSQGCDNSTGAAKAKLDAVAAKAMVVT